jgi:hypothetical protein
MVCACAAFLVLKRRFLCGHVCDGPSSPFLRHQNRKDEGESWMDLLVWIYNLHYNSSLLSSFHQRLQDRFLRTTRNTGHGVRAAPLSCSELKEEGLRCMSAPASALPLSCTSLWAFKTVFRATYAASAFAWVAIKHHYDSPLLSLLHSRNVEKCQRHTTWCVSLLLPVFKTRSDSLDVCLALLSGYRNQRATPTWSFCLWSLPI